MKKKSDTKMEEQEYMNSHPVYRLLVSEVYKGKRKYKKD
jgi:hypothetical protein